MKALITLVVLVASQGAYGWYRSFRCCACPDDNEPMSEFDNFMGFGQSPFFSHSSKRVPVISNVQDLDEDDGADKENSPDDATSSGSLSENRAELLQLHNKYRRKVASGNVNGQPSSSKIHDLVRCETHRIRSPFLTFVVTRPNTSTIILMSHNQTFTFIVLSAYNMITFQHFCKPVFKCGWQCGFAYKTTTTKRNFILTAKILILNKRELIFFLPRNGARNWRPPLRTMQVAASFAMMANPTAPPPSGHGLGKTSPTPQALPSESKSFKQLPYFK